MKDYPFDGDRTIFLGDLSFFCTENDLLPLCSTYGAVTAIRIRRGNQGKSLLFGFVEYTFPEAARIASVELNGQLFMGRYLR